jgi:hypothetical protein
MSLELEEGSKSVGNSPAIDDSFAEELCDSFVQIASLQLDSIPSAPAMSPD